jgi:hypothetical protein
VLNIRGHFAHGGVTPEPRAAGGIIEAATVYWDPFTHCETLKVRELPCTPAGMVADQIVATRLAVRRDKPVTIFAGTDHRVVDDFPAPAADDLEAVSRGRAGARAWRRGCATSLACPCSMLTPHEHIPDHSIVTRTPHSGDTDPDNLVSLCRPHHRAVHEQGWRLHIADGVALVEPPP